MSPKAAEVVVEENSRSVAGRELPPIPKQHENDDGTGTILLFYQYKEPEWTEKEHKSMLKKVIRLGEKCQITGRGRVAPEGLNCTLSGSPRNIRDFCLGLRALDDLFRETDFKLTDGVPSDKLFKSLSIRKTQELVAYGLAGGEKAPSLKKFAGDHLEATDYHQAMTKKDTVIVDVRNQYESALGHFAPPQDGAELIDPQLRNSIEFPKWLAAPETQKKLHNKTVLMYCTGGIRCERATALLNQMSTVNPEQLKPKAVYELRGGIERYVKTYPEGGFWKGKNYLFDRRAEQTPGDKDEGQVENETDAKCCLCRQKWTVYRGKFKCSQGLCGVPVIVCDTCRTEARANPKGLTCELCKVGYKAPKTAPDLINLKRKAEEKKLSPGQPTDSSSSNASAEESSSSRPSKKHKADSVCADRLFVARCPLTVTKTKLEQALNGGPVERVHWLTDRRTGAFYGSCQVQMASSVAAAKAASVAAKTSIKIDKKKVRVSMARSKDIEKWPPANYEDREYPPVGRA